MKLRKIYLTLALKKILKKINKFINNLQQIYNNKININKIKINKIKYIKGKFKFNKFNNHYLIKINL